MKAITQYMSRYACPEIALALNVERTYSHVVVIPALAESSDFVSRLEGAVRGVEPVLCIVVVNARECATTEVHRQNLRLIDDLRQWPSGGDLDVMVVDRATGARRFSDKEGVGLARKIGCDIALALLVSGRVRSPWIHLTDGDATPPAGYFAAASKANRNASCLVYPFWHSTDDVALLLYEMSLRYYVLGLQWARSPYAFHVTGSALAVRGEAYAKVRGVPNKRAGEDFYFANKLAKVGVVQRPNTEPITLNGRPSDRVPFGTGAATPKIQERLENNESFLIYSPQCFTWLRSWLAAIERFVISRRDAAFDALPVQVRAIADQQGGIAALRDAATQCKAETTLRKRAHDWFDGFRTMKFMHAARDEASANNENIDWREAFAQAPFMAAVAHRLPDSQELAEIVTLRQAVYDIEAAAHAMSTGERSRASTTGRITRVGTAAPWRKK